MRRIKSLLSFTQVILAAYVTYATVLATVFTSSILAPQLFVFYRGLIIASLSSISSFQSLQSICTKEQPAYNMSLPVHYNNDLSFNLKSDLAVDMGFLDMDSLLPENETDSFPNHYNTFQGKIGNPMSSHAFKYRMVNANQDIIPANPMKDTLLRPISLKDDDESKTDISSILDRDQITIDSFVNNLLRTIGTCQADSLLTSQKFCTMQESIPCIVI